MDLVYVVGNGSNWGNRELWYSLASVAKNLTGVGRVFVVGSNPGFLSDKVTFIPVAEPYDPRLNPAGNIITKLMAACNAGVSENFLLMNDDFIILQPTHTSEIPVLHKGRFSEYPDTYFNSGNYRLRMRKTFKILKDLKAKDYNFGVHTPMPLNRSRLRSLINSTEWKSGVGVSLRTLYGNIHVPEGDIIKLTDQKRTVYEHYSLESLQQSFNGIRFMAFNDRGLNRPLKSFLKDQFSATHIYAKGTLPELPERQALHKRLPHR